MSADATVPPMQRMAALMVALTSVTPLVVATTLVPAAAGMGTHRQLGLPSCTWPMFFGIPCFTCGMTTSFAHAVRGEWLGALWAQPGGFLLALLCALATVVAGWCAILGQPVHRLVRPLARGRTAAIAVAMLVVAWGWKILVVRGGTA
jgi:hypothetical protein